MPDGLLNHLDGPEAPYNYDYALGKLEVLIDQAKAADDDISGMGPVRRHLAACREAVLAGHI